MEGYEELKPFIAKRKIRCMYLKDYYEEHKDIINGRYNKKYNDDKEYRDKQSVRSLSRYYILKEKALKYDMIVKKLDELGINIEGMDDFKV